MSGTTLSQRTPAPRLPGQNSGLTATVPRELVHRSAVAEVLLTGSAKLDEGRFALTGQWPRAHAFFTEDNGPRHDPVIAAETIRQAGLYLAHTEFDVPVGHTFLLRRMDFTTVDAQLAIGIKPTDITLDATLERVRSSRTSTVVELRFTIRRDDRLVATGGGEFTCLSPAVYRRIRGSYERADLRTMSNRDAPAPVPAELVGRQAEKDVVLAATDTPRRWTVSPDWRNAVLFDHGGDHIPGMVLLEAARQAAHTLIAPAGGRPLAASVHFERYAELHAPCTVEADWQGAPGPHGTVGIVGRQAGETVFTGTVSGAGAVEGPAEPPAAGGEDAPPQA
ncbi:ScbA/BarX family gamma-butyrolactone biosynthesis protein [Streptomyces sp. HNM0574]|uniref:ScbA/BarX family gamma-butyrolactone biosynthesis protein n=1 Tax=Streptomyces sp. HNM0574 TaxID=2714954 RepID=UPI00146B7169|nr:ScbA/BarX family gamma-butyrolactone biosynthesis protein [Streptomyces sp. HNM0574]NLU68574.1 hypothetical protein [Streptomyces sp. HNM0574]